jgi:glycosyltransferase involved in cell wall biosynthesis
MRIAVINWSRRQVGGVETYLNQIISGLHRVGHDMAFWSEIDEPVSRERIFLPDGSPAWCVAELGTHGALSALRNWQPDIIYSHGLLDPELEARTVAICPAVFFAHSYYGTCISGAKTFKFPVVTPCDRRFGWQCLLHYYPHRCGGQNPVTMLREYERQSQRLNILRRYKAILANSQHIHDEYLKHGFPSECVHIPTDAVYDSRETLKVLQCGSLLPTLGPQTTPSCSMGEQETRPWRLLFVGRMDLLKGGRIFLDALPQVSVSLRQPLSVTFAGDGPRRRAWERKAAVISRRAEFLDIEFVGWKNTTQLESVYADADLLVMPSLWPEPFGKIGPEAGLKGIPAVAFSVGGISDWLVDGVNGYLAPGNPPSAPGLAEAIFKCLRNRDNYARLRRGAVDVATQFSLSVHRTKLISVFERVMTAGRSEQPNVFANGLS